MREIFLKNGGVTLVDDEDYERLNKYTWIKKRERNIDYAIRYLWKDGKVVFKRGIHRDILNAEKNQPIDHIDHDGLNNQRSNLRIITQQGNQFNRGVATKTGYIGIFETRDGQYGARIHDGKQRPILGIFKTAIEAAKAYDAAAYRLHGEGALLNFPRNS